MPYLKRRLWTWLLANQMTLPPDIRQKISAEKWASEWFVSEWFSRPVHVLHIEIWHRVWRLAQHLCRQDNTITAIDDYGCGNGSFIRSAPLVLPGLTAYRGWEFSDRAVDLLRSRYADSIVSFRNTSLAALLSQPEHSIITTVGVLVYMDKSELGIWLKAIASTNVRKTLILAEPTEYGLERWSDSSFRAHDTYNHSYMQLIEDAGLKIIHNEVVHWPPDHPWVIIAAETLRMADGSQATQ